MSNSATPQNIEDNLSGSLPHRARRAFLCPESQALSALAHNFEGG